VVQRRHKRDRRQAARVCRVRRRSWPADRACARRAEPPIALGLCLTMKVARARPNPLGLDDGEGLPALARSGPAAHSPVLSRSVRIRSGERAGPAPAKPSHSEARPPAPQGRAGRFRSPCSPPALTSLRPAKLAQRTRRQTPDALGGQDPAPRRTRHLHPSAPKHLPAPMGSPEPGGTAAPSRQAAMIEPPSVLAYAAGTLVRVRACASAARAPLPLAADLPLTTRFDVLPYGRRP
jgi:hypothetical protein